MAATLPSWALWLQALGPVSLSAITAGVAIVVAVISWKQWDVAKAKLQLDLFEKRFGVFLDARRVLSQLAQKGMLDREDGGLPNEIIARGRFLFGPEVLDLLMEMHSLNTSFIVKSGDAGAIDPLLKRITAAMDPYLAARAKV